MEAQTKAQSQKQNLSNAARTITREQLDLGIVAMLAEAMANQARKITIVTIITKIAVLSGRLSYVIALVAYMLSRQHYLGAILVLTICISYDDMQKALYKQDYYTLAAFSGVMVSAAALYIWMDGRGEHLCLVVLGMFVFRYIQIWLRGFAEDVEDILYARDVVIKEGIGDNEKIVVKTRRQKQYVYEWDEEAIAKYMEDGGKFPDAAPFGYIEEDS